MNKFILYSILQYKHSLKLGEILNVGILFYFPEDKQFEFSYGDATRLKAIYPDFNISLFNSYIKNIKLRIKGAVDLFSGYPLGNDFINYIHNHILAQDAAGLVFGVPNNVINVFKDKETTVNEFSKLLLPGINIEKPEKKKHNEEYLVRKFRGYFKNEKIDDYLTKNETITTKHFTHKFDYLFQNQSDKRYIKPFSFDLKEEASIQYKSAAFYGILSDLYEYRDSKNYSFDFLIAKPQDTSLNRAYQNALDYVDSIKLPKKLILENKIEEYTDSILSELVFE